MKASLPALGSIRLPRSQLILTALLVIVGVGAELLILLNLAQLSRSIDFSLAPARNLLPQISALRGDVLLLHADTETELSRDLPDYDLLITRRASVADRLAALRAIAPATDDFTTAFASVDTMLTIFDSEMVIIRNDLDPAQLPAHHFEIKRAYEGAEAALDTLYQGQEQAFYAATASTFDALRATQIILFSVGIIVLLLGVALVVSIRRAARRESVLASGRLQVAAEVGAAAASVLSLDQLFDTTLNLICERFGYVHAAIFLVDDKGEYATLRAATGEAGRKLLAAGHRVLVGSNSTIGAVTFSNQHRLFRESRRTTEYFTGELLEPARSELAVPLRQSGHVIGALDVQSRDDDAFTGEDISILQTLADQVSVAIGNAAEFTREQARARQMAALSEATAELTGPQVTFDSLLEIIARRARILLAADDAQVWMPGDADDLQLRASVTQPSRAGQRIKVNEGVAGQVFVGAQPLTIEDYRRWQGRRSTFLEDGAIHSIVGVPLMWQGEVSGVLIANRLQQSRQFTIEDERIAALFASQAAAAIQNAQLLQETQDRVNELYTLNQIGQALAAQTDLRSLFDVVRQETTRAVNARNFYIALYDADTNLVELPYVYEAGDISSVAPFPLGEGLTSIVISNRLPLLLTTKEEASTLGALVAGTPSESYLGVPIIVRDSVLGAIAVQDADTPYLFRDTESRLLSTIASQLGLAIQNVRLIEQTRRRAEELSALNRVTATAASVGDLQTSLEDVAREVVRIFDAQSASIALLDLTRERLTTIADYSASHSVPSARGQVIAVESTPALAQAVETGQPIVVHNAQTSWLTEPIHGPLRERGIASEMIVPLLARGEVIGVININSDQPERAFTPAEISLAETIAGQTSSAIDNTRLFDQVRRRAEQLAAAAAVSHAAISALDPDELMSRAAELIRQQFDLYYVAFFLVDEGRQWAILRYGTGEAGKKMMEQGHRLEVGGNSMVGTAINTRQARIALDTGREAVRFANPHLPDTHSELALPLIIGDSALGALDVQSTQYSAFADADIAVLQTMADQIAVAIQNARLYLQAERRVKLEQFVNRVTAKLRRAVNAENIIAETLGELQQALGARRVVARLGPDYMLRAAPSAPADGNGHSPMDQS